MTPVASTGCGRQSLRPAHAGVAALLKQMLLARAGARRVHRYVWVSLGHDKVCELPQIPGIPLALGTIFRKRIISLLQRGPIRLR